MKKKIKAWGLLVLAALLAFALSAGIIVHYFKTEFGKED